ncbi:MAG: hypothetical protein ACRYF9_11725 [Janthinobacterium lividum]|jgi:hypothetical protein|uniref:hypothetical protein n=1 Tax=Pseudomonas baltica TaxID=2762576 RepID=UPI0028A045D1|nr:hypothetical protein [Pseudomonas baltica]
MPAKPPTVAAAPDTGIEADIDAAAVAPETAPAQDSKAAVPAFRFPFNAGALTKPGPANYPGAGKSNHDKTPGRAPNGTRRSMGKR